jgi:two-component sensor histidine kinase
MDRNRRGPFREEFRVIDRKDGAIRWLSAIGRTEFENDLCTRFIGVIRDVTEEKQAEEHRRLLTNELDHRAKNLLAVVAGIVDATIRTASDLATARRDAGNRLASLGRAHDLLTAESWVSAEVIAVVRGTIEAVSLPADRLEIGGPLVRLGPKAALQLALALHELATNSVKYGALSNDTGRIRIHWMVEDEGGESTFLFRWEERGGPLVSPPGRRGFGSRLIEAATAAEFQGSSNIVFDPSGVRWELRAPLTGIDRGQ